MKKLTTLLSGLALLLVLCANTNQSFAQEWETVGNDIYNTNTGSVGIGTMSPVQKLHVTGNLQLGTGGRVFGFRTTGEPQEMFTLDGNNDIIFNRSSIVSGLNSNLLFGVGLGKTFQIINAGFVPLFAIDEASRFVGIGTSIPEARLDVRGTGRFSGRVDIHNSLIVDGKITSREVEVRLDVWPDFVFADDYDLKPLRTVEQFISENRHLPGIPSEKQVLKEGVEIGQMTALLLQKIEELTLYVIEIDKQNELLKELVQELKSTK